MALGLCCMTEMPDECDNFFKGHPFININESNLFDCLNFLIQNASKIDDYKRRSLDWIKQNHDVCVVGEKLYTNYQKIIK